MDSDSTKWMKLKSGSDIEGSERQLTGERVEKLGYAFALMLAQKLETTPDTLIIAVGRDARVSGAAIKAALVRGITAADADVQDCGVCAAPALFLAASKGLSGAVEVTGGHRSEGTNGLKFITAAGGLREEEVDALLELARTAQVPERLVTRADALEGYMASLRAAAARWLEDDALKPLLGMRVIVDAAGGTGAFFGKLLDAMGVEAESLAPLKKGGEAAALERLQALVPEHRADLGVLLDQDCARATLVDADGRLLNDNRLIALTAAMLLDADPGATIVTDSVTSSGLTAFIQEWGGVHYRFKRGHRNVIDEAARLNAEGIDCPLAIETSGHAAYRENGFLDDGPYLALRVICEALNRKREGKTLTSLIDDLQEPVERAEIRLSFTGAEAPEDASQMLVEAILSHTLDNPAWQMASDSREGVRITFNLDGGVNNAWFQLRMSVHGPVMPLNAESAVPGGVKRVLTELYALIRDTDLVDLAPLREAVGEAEQS